MKDISDDEVQSQSQIQQLHEQLQGILENLPGVVFRCILKADGSLHYPYLSAAVPAKFWVTGPRN
ncbi:MAG: hypothetical protein GY807_11495 [Gammaproteobacteria bacterium]|nr:hypothetical protein [Gammaproteobacteria bacterium]